MVRVLLEPMGEVSMATERGRTTSRAQRGFSLMELLLVVFIIGIIAAISTLAVSGTLKKARLDQMAETVRGLLGRARAYASTNQTFVFVVIGPTGPGPLNAGNYQDASGPKGIFLIVDLNNNRVPDDALINNTSDYLTCIGHGTLTSLAGTIPVMERGNEDISLSTTNMSWIETNWPVYLGPTTGTTPYDNNYAMLVVDPMGRTLDPNTGTMVNQTMTLNMTHRDMVRPPGGPGSLHPMHIRTMRISPLYGVTIQKH